MITCQQLYLQVVWVVEKSTWFHILSPWRGGRLELYSSGCSKNVSRHHTSIEYRHVQVDITLRCTYKELGDTGGSLCVSTYNKLSYQNSLLSIGIFPWAFHKYDSQGFWQSHLHRLMNNNVRDMTFPKLDPYLTFLRECWGWPPRSTSGRFRQCVYPKWIISALLLLMFNLQLDMCWLHILR